MTGVWRHIEGDAHWLDILFVRDDGPEGSLRIESPGQFPHRHIQLVRVGWPDETTVLIEPPPHVRLAGEADVDLRENQDVDHRDLVQCPFACQDAQRRKDELLVLLALTVVFVNIRRWAVHPQVDRRAIRFAKGAIGVLQYDGCLSQVEALRGTFMLIAIVLHIERQLQRLFLRVEVAAAEKVRQMDTGDECAQGDEHEYRHQEASSGGFLLFSLSLLSLLLLHHCLPFS